MKARPLVGQPPKLVMPVKTLEAELRGARIHRGIRTPKKPSTWMTNTMLSMKGSFLARKELKMMQNPTIAITRSVPCQRSKWYVSRLSRTISP